MTTPSNHAPPDWTRFYLENRRALLTCASAWCGNADDALDLIQEALTRQMACNAQPENLRAYVLRSIRNLAIDRIRGGRVSEVLDVDIRAMVRESDPLDVAESHQQLTDALAQLPQPQREAILLRAVANLTIAEAAEVLEKPPGSIASAYARGIESLRATLNSEQASDQRQPGKSTRQPANR